jgi:hypothetical protein
MTNRIIACGDKDSPKCRSTWKRLPRRIDVLNGAASSRDHRIVGYAENIDFWTAEIVHRIAAIDGFPKRQALFVDAVKRAADRIREAELHNEQGLGIRADPTRLFYGEAPTSSQTENHVEKMARLRTRLVEAARKFIGRIRNEELIEADQWQILKGLAVVEEYQDLKEAIEAAGFFTTFQPIDELGDRIVCASEGGDWGMGGRSFWCAVRQGRWFIATWTPRLYEIPHAADVAQLAIDVLTNNENNFDINPEIKTRFGLVEIADEQFDAL